ncbi:aminoglycoside phosphotransferase family protein [Nonomuraea sp. NEAU-A123]|uniref:aminoglycoside phosphotransferase family protein n=1 Tax=Nonomuraea sp. NEAU-A123 TaxID=2839649 RepID=UPI001BE42917|nr:aminoglycoside phosphotransferase family protein [Nonomuraea sp. NEAU-A123]MBT2228981.1 aminoglycoside phosphotransferase family protein [Nonomuraea sp. NEAU-A123]
MDGFEIDEKLVRSLLHEQHPDLVELGLHQGTIGWSNQLWRLGDELAVRLPRRAHASPGLRNEQLWLPVLAPRLPLPVPTPFRIGEPSACFPWPWTVVTWVPGEPGDRAPISHGHHTADILAGFLRALHLNAPTEAPANPIRSFPFRTFTHEFDRRVEAVASRIAVTDVRAVWDEALSAPDWEGPPVWLHADLHPANVVVSGGTISGVIDFGELCAGDPATDLAAAWLILPEGAATRFFDAYENVDEAMIRRARGWAVHVGVGLIGIGQAWERGLPGGQPTWGPVGRTALDRVLASS